MLGPCNVVTPYSNEQDGFGKHGVHGGGHLGSHGQGQNVNNVDV